MKSKLPLAFVAGAIVALLLLAANMALTVTSTRQLRDDAVQVQHSNDVRRALEHVLSLVKDAENGQRGFVITGKPDYLEPYRSAVRAMTAQVDTLAALVKDEPSQQAAMNELRRRVDARLGELDVSVAARQRSGFAAAQEIMQLGAGKAQMDGLRAAVRTMVSEEDRRLAEREEQAARSFRNALAAGLVSGGAALLGVVAFVLLLGRHLHERDRAEEALSAEAEKFRTALVSIGDAVIATDLAGRITNMNAVAEALTGWRGAEAAGKPLAEVFRTVDEVTRAEVDSPVGRALGDGAVGGSAHHTVLIGKDGSERPIDDSAAPIHGPGGEPSGAVLVFRDVSERRRNEKALQDAEARLRRVVMEMAVPTMAFAEDGVVLFVNDAWVRRSGWPREQLTTIAEWTSRAYPERGGFMRQHILSMFDLKERVDSGERQVTTASGAQRTWHFYTAPIGKDAAGRRLLVTNAIDMTDFDAPAPR